ncbi:FeoB small GTPase domain-containing protein [Halodesulfurarchaeum formicicum]|uniref:FeoB small GTPase domain-containing protein n=1 Tax=Halodesulfurarchaeum formicicum TaxID=1873524 RepID=UPI0009F6BEF2|nr:FeoB small GTPase domain-containing protein [Halodesulfurarchaeum formicicum]
MSLQMMSDRPSILLVGHPNVGKSALFNQLTGSGNIDSNVRSNKWSQQGFWPNFGESNVTESNYPGTTVDYTHGELQYQGESIDVIDVPGTFSLSPKNASEEVAVEILEEHSDAVVVCVLDATRIERGLNLLLEIIDDGYDVTVAANMIDEARKQNIQIDVAHLEHILDVPVVPTVATTGEGLKDLVESIEAAHSPSLTAIQERTEGTKEAIEG